MIMLSIHDNVGEMYLEGVQSFSMIVNDTAVIKSQKSILTQVYRIG